MKTTKFIISTDDVDCWDMGLTDEQVDKFYNGCESGQLRVIECIHPKFEDNVITTDEAEFVVDHTGTIHYFVDSISREEAIKIFE